MSQSHSKRRRQPFQMAIERLEPRLVQSAASVAVPTETLDASPPERIIADAVHFNIRDLPNDFVLGAAGTFNESWSGATRLLITSYGEVLLTWGTVDPSDPYGYVHFHVDPRFGDHGRLLLENGGLGEPQLLATPDGGAFVVSFGWDNSSQHEVAVFYKLTADGRLDPAFARQGVPQQVPSGGYWLRSIDSQSRILAYSSGDSAFQNRNGTEHIIRFLPDGTLDPSFGAGGVVTISGKLDGWFIANDLFNTPDGGLKLQIASYEMHDYYYFSGDGQFLRSESNNAFNMGTLEVNGAPMVAAAAASPAPAASTVNAVPFDAPQPGATVGNTGLTAQPNTAVGVLNSPAAASSGAAATLTSSESGLPEVGAIHGDQSTAGESDSALDQFWVDSALLAERPDCLWETVP